MAGSFDRAKADEAAALGFVLGLYLDLGKRKARGR